MRNNENSGKRRLGYNIFGVDDGRHLFFSLGRKLFYLFAFF